MSKMAMDVERQVQAMREPKTRKEKKPAAPRRRATEKTAKREAGPSKTPKRLVLQSALARAVVEKGVLLLISSGDLPAAESEEARNLAARLSALKG